jgi:hypothetical protein
MRERIPARQVRKAPNVAVGTRAATAGGRTAADLYTTCLSIYNLQVYYRHLPIYRH